ncbi:YfhO family protein [Candidatus Daviesbacteria bacterium]|nr:YfhO family protein [Candidatus Daviesbacteria bacterium]
MTHKIFKFYPMVILLTLLVIFFGKALTGQEIFVTPDIGGSDILHYEYATKYFLSESLKKHQLPLWNPYIATGFPQMGTITGDFNPVNLLLFYFLPMPLVFNLYLALTFFLTGFFTYLFARSLKISRLGSLLCSISITFSGILVTKIVHSIMLQTFTFFPLELYFVEKYLQKKRLFFILCLSLAIGLQILSGYLQIVLYCLIILLLYFGLRLYLEQALRLKSMCIIFAAIIIGFIIASVQLLPNLEFTGLSTRSGGVDIEVVEKLPYPLQHLVTFIWPYLLGDPRSGTYPWYSENWGIFWENTGYIGILPLILAFLAVFWGLKKNSNVVIFFLIITFTFFLMLGKYSPVFFLYNIPPLSFFRVPARWIIFFTFGLVILAGFGFDQFFKKSAIGKHRKSIIPMVILALIVLNLFAFSFFYNPRGDALTWLNEPETVKFLKTDLSDYRIISFGTPVLWNKQLQSKGWDTKADGFKAFLQGLEPNWNVVYRINHAGLYAVIQTQRGSTLNSALKRNIGGQARDLLDLENVKYIISPLPVDGRDLELVFTSSSQPKYYIYQNKTVSARVFLVSNWVLIPDQTGQYQALMAGDVNFKKTAIVEQEIPNLGFKNGEAKILKHGNNNVEVAANLDGDGLLVLADSYYPGWRATVDGVETKILPVNINQRGVLLRTGEHIVKFKFQPESLKWGIIISALSLLIVTSLVVFFKKKDL